MGWSNNGCLCNNVIISTAVTFTAPNLIIDIPAGSYANGKKYCIVIAQDIPTATTIAANVVISIGGNTATLYPLTNCDGTNVTACQISTRSIYATRVRTNIQSGVFQLFGNIKNNCSCACCANKNAAPSLPIPAAAAPAVAEANLNRVVVSTNSAIKPINKSNGGENE